jgi:hypothetical protein
MADASRHAGADWDDASLRQSLAGGLTDFDRRKGFLHGRSDQITHSGVKVSGWLIFDIDGGRNAVAKPAISPSDIDLRRIPV